MENWGLSDEDWDKIRLRVVPEGMPVIPSEIQETLRGGSRV